MKKPFCKLTTEPLNLLSLRNKLCSHIHTHGKIRDVVLGKGMQAGNRTDCKLMIISAISQFTPVKSLKSLSVCKFTFHLHKYKPNIYILYTYIYMCVCMWTL